MASFVIGFFVGGFFGVLITVIAVSASVTSRREEDRDVHRR